MDMIQALTEFNRCRRLDDFTRLIAGWAGAGEALALYVADPTGRVLTLTATHGEALDTCESDMFRAALGAARGVSPCAI